jgi:hypothetical protein
MLCVDAPVGVYVREQLLVNVPALPSETSVQLAAGLKPPEPVEPNVTDPAGSDCDAPALSVSVTVAVHVVPWATTTDPGLQLTAVDVVRLTVVYPVSVVDGDVRPARLPIAATTVLPPPPLEEIVVVL